MASLRPPAEEFTFVIQHSQGEKLGLELVADATTGLFWIQGIKEGSPAVQSWLTAWTLRCGDCIKAVNGIEDNLDRMREEMFSQTEVRLSICRWHVGVGADAA